MSDAAHARGVDDRGIPTSTSSSAQRERAWAPPRIVPGPEYLDTWFDYAKRLYIQGVLAWDWPATALRSHHLGLLSLAAVDAERIRAAHFTPPTLRRMGHRDTVGARADAARQWADYEAALRSAIDCSLDPQVAISRWLDARARTYPDVLADLKLATHDVYGTSRHEWEMDRERFARAWNSNLASGQEAPTGLLIEGTVTAVVGPPESMADVERRIAGRYAAENIAGTALDYAGVRAARFAGAPSPVFPDVQVEHVGLVPSPRSSGSGSVVRGTADRGTAAATRASAASAAAAPTPTSAATGSGRVSGTPRAAASTTPGGSTKSSSPSSSGISDSDRGLAPTPGARPAAAGGGPRDYSTMGIDELRSLHTRDDAAASLELTARYDRLTIRQLREIGATDDLARFVLTEKYKTLSNHSLGQYARYDPVAARVREGRLPRPKPPAAGLSPPPLPKLASTDPAPMDLAGRSTVPGSARPGSGEAFVGTSQDGLRRRAAQIIRSTPGHPLSFLLSPGGDLWPTQQKGQSMPVIIEDPRLVQAGHITSNKAGGPERVMIQLAWTNQRLGATVERTAGAYVQDQVVVSIGGIAVELGTALFWDQFSADARRQGVDWLPPGIVANAPIVEVP